MPHLPCWMSYESQVGMALRPRSVSNISQCNIFPRWRCTCFVLVAAKIFVTWLPPGDGFGVPTALFVFDRSESLRVTMRHGSTPAQRRCGKSSRLSSTYRLGGRSRMWKLSARFSMEDNDDPFYEVSEPTSLLRSRPISQAGGTISSGCA